MRRGARRSRTAQRREEARASMPAREEEERSVERGDVGGHRKRRDAADELAPRGESLHEEGQCDCRRDRDRSHRRAGEPASARVLPVRNRGGLVIGIVGSRVLDHPDHASDLKKPGRDVLHDLAMDSVCCRWYQPTTHLAPQPMTISGTAMNATMNMTNQIGSSPDP